MRYSEAQLVSLGHKNHCFFTEFCEHAVEWTKKTIRLLWFRELRQKNKLCFYLVFLATTTEAGQFEHTDEHTDFTVLCMP